MTEEQKHNHIKEIAEDYVSKSWNTFLDLDEVDLVYAGIGVGKIIEKECQKEHEQEIERCNKLINDMIEIYPDIYKLWDFSLYPFLKIKPPKENE